MATTKNDDTAEVERLRKENAVLRRKVAAQADDKPSTEAHVPDWLPEGTRQDLVNTGRAVNPFTGEKLGDWPDD